MTTRPAPSIRTGLCSVTFRDLGVEEIIALAVGAGLESIEWGTDIHLPLDDLEHATRVGVLTRDAGLAVASLGSYFRCTPSEDIDAVLAVASAVGAPRARVWAGRSGSASSSSADRAETTAILRESALRAEDNGIELALEFHGGTLTDTAESAARLLESVGSDAVSSYWQPPVGLADDAAMVEFQSIAPWVSTLHVFSWWPGNDRLPLDSRSELWSRVFAASAALPRITDALLEFVPDDDAGILPREAATLRSVLS